MKCVIETYAMAETLIHDSSRMYLLRKTNGGTFVLDVVCGGVGMYEVSLPLNTEEVDRYLEEGKPYIDHLASLVTSNPNSEYSDRLMPT